MKSDNPALHECNDAKLRPEVVTAAAVSGEGTKVSPLLWPLVGYLGAGTLLLYLVAQLERLAFAIKGGAGSGVAWHEVSPGWVAVYPVTLPLLLVRVAALYVYAIPAGLVRLLRTAVTRALRAARALVVSIVAWLRPLLADAMRAVRQTAEATVRRVRAALSR